MLDDLGLIHMNGRIYDPKIGRFLSADPHIQSPINLQSYNRYSYVLNNPLKYTDPTGYDYLAMMSMGYQDPAIAYLTGGEDAMQNAVNLNLDRGETQAMVGIAAAPVGASMIPWVGEAMDGALAYFGTEEDRVFIAASLMVNAESGGVAPNYAAVKVATWAGRHMDEAKTLSRSVRAARTVTEEGKNVAKAGKAVEKIAKEAPINDLLSDVNKSNITEHSNIDLNGLYSRATPRRGLRDKVWERNRSIDGKVYDPSGIEIKPGEPWELGHIPGHKFSDSQKKAFDEGWSRSDWLNYQNDPDIYRPEKSYTNRSHFYEDEWYDLYY